MKNSLYKFACIYNCFSYEVLFKFFADTQYKTNSKHLFIAFIKKKCFNDEYFF